MSLLYWVLIDFWLLDSDDDVAMRDLEILFLTIDVSQPLASEKLKDCDDDCSLQAMAYASYSALEAMVFHFNLRARERDREFSNWLPSRNEI